LYLEEFSKWKKKPEKREYEIPCGIIHMHLFEERRGQIDMFGFGS
jgi:hypothetical protein